MWKDASANCMHVFSIMDTSFFIKAFSASPKAVVPGYIIGGILRAFGVLTTYYVVIFLPQVPDTTGVTPGGISVKMNNEEGREEHTTDLIPPPGQIIYMLIRILTFRHRVFRHPVGYWNIGKLRCAWS